MSEAKTFESLDELLRDTFDDEGQFADEVKESIDEQELASLLFQMRNKRGLTQDQVAKRMGVTQSAVSKLEHSTADRISVRELEKYAKATDVNLVISFEERMSASDRVKSHFFEIKRLFDELHELAEGDQDILDGVDGFYNEWLVNTLKHVAEGKALISKQRKPKTSGERMKVVGPKSPPDNADLRRLLANVKERREEMGRSNRKTEKGKRGFSGTK